MRIAIFVFVLSAVGIAGCGEQLQPEGWDETLETIREEFPEVRQISTEELAGWMDEHGRTPPLLLDVREAEEFDVSHIRGARLVTPGSELARSIRDAEKGTALVAYCSVGYRSAKVAQVLQGMGYTNVYNLEGSLFKWANEGREVVRDGQIVHEVHPYDEHWGQLLDPDY